MNFKPMLAHPVSDDINEEQGYLQQPKLDGIRAYITKDGIFSRNNKQFNNCEHILTELESFFISNPDIILDGELYNHLFKSEFEKIVSLVKKKTPTQQDKFQSASYIQFHCYDYFNPNSPEVYIQRWNQIDWWKHVYKWRSIQVVDTNVVWGQADIDKYYAIHTAAGYEGSILRVNGLYEQKRSKNLLKVKCFTDEELTIIGCVKGKGKRSSGIGKFIGVRDNGVQVGIPVMETLDKLIDMWNNRDSYIGKRATVIFFQETNSGSLRHPLFKCIREYE